MAVFPTNDAALVNKLGQILGVNLDVVISLNNLDGTALGAVKRLDSTGCVRNSPLVLQPLYYVSAVM